MKRLFALAFAFLVFLTLPGTGASAYGKQAADFEQTAKTLRHICRLADSIRLKEDDAAQKIVSLLHSQLYSREKKAATPDPLKEAVLHSLLAQSLMDYYRSFCWGMEADNPPAPPSETVDYKNLSDWKKNDFRTQILLQTELSYKKTFSEPDKTLLYDSIKGLAFFGGSGHTYRPGLKELLLYRALSITESLDISQKEKENISEAVFGAFWQHLDNRHTADSAAARLDAGLRYGTWLFQHGRLSPEAYARHLADLLDRYPALPGAGDVYHLLAVNATDKDPFLSERYARKALEYPQSWGAEQSRRLLRQLLSPYLRLYANAVQRPFLPIALQVEEKNCAGFRYHIYRLNPQEQERYLLCENEAEFAKTIPVEEKGPSGFMALPAMKENALREQTGTVALPALPPGFYLLQACADSVRYKGSESIFKTDKTTVHLFFQVSEMGFFCYPEKDGERWRGYVFGRDDAEPMAGVAVDAFFNDYDVQGRTDCLRQIFHTTTDAAGAFSIDTSALKDGNNWLSLRLRFVQNRDTLWFDRYRFLFLQKPSPVRPNPNAAKNPWEAVQHIFFFPNLPVYRPGDSVRVKALVVLQQGDSSVFADESFSAFLPVSVLDPDHRNRLTLHCSIGADGMAEIAFRIPENAKTGQWEVNVADKRAVLFLSVENYKRPSFKLYLNDSLQNLSADSGSIKGLAHYYSGAGVREGKLHYRIYKTLTRFHPKGRDFPSPFRELWAEGETSTQNNGSFAIHFAKIPLEKALNGKLFYEIVCTLTDLGGETQEARMFLPAGSEPFLSAQVPPLLISNGKRWMNEPGLIRFDTACLSGASLQLQLFRLSDSLETSPYAPALSWNEEEPGFTHYMRLSQWRQTLPEEPYFSLAERNAQVGFTPVDWVPVWENNACRLPENLPPGCYEYRLLAYIGNHDSVACNGRFLLARTQAPLSDGFGKAGFFVLPDNSEGNLIPNRISVLAGNAASKPMLWRFYIEDIQGNHAEYTRQVMPGCRVLNLPTEGLSHRGNLLVAAFSQIDNHYFFSSFSADLPQENLDPEISAVTFPESGEAGRELHFCLRIESPHKAGRIRPVLVGMYDASLHHFAPQGLAWPALRPFSPSPHQSWNRGFGTQEKAYGHVGGNFRQDAFATAYPAPAADLQWQGVFFSSWERKFKTDAVMKNASSPADKATELENLYPPRHDFRPDVFFKLIECRKVHDTYLLDFSARAPEYFGEFVVCAFAYSDPLHSGYFERRIRIDKPVMLSPQHPRFVRQNDSLVLRCRYTQTAEDAAQDIPTEAVFQTHIRTISTVGEIIDLVKSEDRLRNLQPQSYMQTELKIPEGCQKLIAEYRLSLYRKGETLPFAYDAVVDSVPVLPDRISLRQTHPFSLRAGESQTLLSSFSLQADSLCFSFTATPNNLMRKLWEGVQFDSCKTSIDAALKMAAWYFAGKEWKSVWPVLQAFATREGGWGWLKESRSNYFITLQVLSILGYIPQKELQTIPQLRNTVQPALRFLFDRTFHDFQKDTADRQGTVRDVKIHYLHVLSLWKTISGDMAHKTAACYYRQKALENSGKLSLTEKALLLRHLLAIEDVENAEKILAELNWLALYHPQKGMYWKEESLGFLPGEKLKSLSELAHAYRDFALKTAAKKENRADTLWMQYKEILNRILFLQRTVDIDNPLSGTGLTEKVAYAAAYPSFSIDKSQADTAFEGLLTVSIGKTRREFAQTPATFTLRGDTCKKFRNKTLVSWRDPFLGKTSSRIGYGYLTAFGKENITEVKQPRKSHGLKLARTYRNLSETEAMERFSCNGPSFNLGDRIKVTLTLQAEYDMNYVHLRCPKPAGLEWENTHPGYVYAGGLYYYKAVDDTGVDYFIEFLPKGRYLVSFILYADTEGSFGDAPAWVECTFDAGTGTHTDAGKIQVKP